MPGGATLLSGVVATGATPAVIALSSRPEAQRDALFVGADAFVSKCDPPEQIARALAAIALSTRLSNAIQQSSLAAGPKSS
jgi:DNA-binding NarL/FixJ family response regulator